MRLNIQGKLMVGFIIIIGIMLVVIAFILWELNAVTATTEAAFNNEVQAIQRVKQLRAIFAAEEEKARKFAVTSRVEYYNAYVERHAEFERGLDTLEMIESTAEETNLVQQIRAGNRDLFDRLHNDPIALSPPDADQSISSIDMSLQQVYASLDQLVLKYQTSMSNAVREVKDSMIRAKNTTYLLTVGAILTALIVALVLSRLITRPIDRLKRGTVQIARGNFITVHVSSHDEVGELATAVNKMSRALAAVNQLKNELMLHLAHELRTPLQAMLAAHFILTRERAGPLTDQQRDLLKSIHDGVLKLTRFSNQYLDISKIESGMMEFAFEPTDLTSLLETVLDEARLIASRKNITIELHQSSVPEMLTDKEKISQVFSNLLSNAIKYTPEDGSIRVTIAPNRSSVYVAVQDSGVGIDNEDLPNIFTKFYQAKNARLSSGKGTGVGLALVKALVEGHGGKVSATSEVGKGSTFRVDLPTAEKFAAVRVEKIRGRG